jgi:toxin ParE1/3/4
VKLRYTLRAAEELDRVLSYIDERSPRLRRVVAHPYPYLIFYTASDDEVVVHGVRHAARRPSSMPE